MTRLVQVLAGASPGDAVTNSAFEIAAVYPGDIHARHIDPALAGRVLPLDALERRADSAADVILLHLSIGEPDLTRWLDGRPERLVLYYHNISPAEAFAPFDPRFAGLLAHGRETLPALVSRAESTVAVSEYNAAELRAAGAAGVVVAPLVVDPARLCGREPDGPTAHHLATVVDGPVVLFVGQLLPHKRPDWLVAAYHALVTYLVPEAHLILVGAARLPVYARALRAYIDELELTRCWVTGAVSDDALAAFYRRADVMVTASEHEGFGAPLVEAMAFGCPVIARNFAAVAETAGDAAVLLGRGDGPLAGAEAMAAVLGDRHLRDELVARGRRRVAHHSAEAARRRLRAALDAAVGS